MDEDSSTTKKKKTFFMTLKKPDWTTEKLKPFRKNFYEEHKRVKDMSSEDVRQYRISARITVQGDVLLNPVTSFRKAGLPKDIGLLETLKKKKYKIPTPIQSQTLPYILSGRDTVGIAQTGSGKTLAYIIPAITHICNQERPRSVGSPIVLILAPTRELVQQIVEVAKEFGDSVGVNIACVYGGVPKERTVAAVRNQIHMCIATPGRLLDLMQADAIKLKSCTFLVLDEADLMLDMGFEAQIREIIPQIRPDRQVVMWSATWPIEITKLAEDFLNDYMEVNIGSIDLSANHSITQIIDVCEEGEKLRKLVNFLEQHMDDYEDKALVFAETKQRCEQLVKVLREKGWTVKELHGNIAQKDRNRTIDKFKDGRCKILIATDVASRGLDITDVKYVVNFDFPQTLEIYVHRIGRTGRWGNSGLAFTLFTRFDGASGYTEGLVAILREADQNVPPELEQMLPERKTKFKTKVYKTN